MHVLAGSFLIAGALFTMIGGLGVIRFNDVMSRMHAAAKAPTLGLILASIGAAIEIATGGAIATLVLVVILQLATSPVASHVLGRAAYRSLDVTLDDEDDLAD